MKKEKGITLIVAVIIFVVLLALIVTIGILLSKGISSGNNINTEKQSTNNSAKSSYAIKINNMSISLPCKYEDIVKAGFQMKDADIDKLKNSTKDSTYAFYPIEEDGSLNPYMEFSACIKAVNGKNVNNAEVAGINTTQYVNTQWLEHEVSINGLKIGVATYQDAIQKFGEASADSTGGNGTEFFNYINFYNSKDGKVRLTFTDENMVRFFVCTESYYTEDGVWHCDFY